MKTKTNVALSIAALAAVIVLFASGPLAASQAQAGGWGHHGVGIVGACHLTDKNSCASKKLFSSFEI